MRSSAFRIAAVLALAGSGPAAATIVNIDVSNAAGTSVLLEAKTYKVTFAGIAGGGTHDAFSFWSGTSGCDGDGGNCARGWLNSFMIDFGGGNGVGYGLATTGGYRFVFNTPERALLEYSTNPLQSATLAQIGSNANYFLQGTNSYTDVTGPIKFTLAAPQSVRFFVVDSFYDDNRGGISLLLTSAIPEPATWAMLVFGFGFVGAALRSQASRTPRKA
jgi:hypothetical protein